MTNSEVKEIVGDTLHMTLRQADKITKLIETNKINDILELGFAHGVSTAYITAVLSRKNSMGKITSINLNHYYYNIKTAHWGYAQKKV